MADLVAAIGIPHTPAFPALVRREGPDCEVSRLFAEIRSRLEAIRPDVLLILTTDHLNTFFFDALPIFAIGVAPTFKGPNDQTPAIDSVEVPSDNSFAAHLRSTMIAHGFDVTLAAEVSVDHSTMVPLHFLTPAMDVPMIPVFINGHIPPLPSAARSFAFGQGLRRGIESWSSPARVAVLGSGSFSLEVHGPRMAAGLPFGVPDPAWPQRVCQLLLDGDFSTLIRETTEEKLAAAGNVAGEILNWIAMLGAYGEGKPSFLQLQPQYGHAYGVWQVPR